MVIKKLLKFQFSTDLKAFFFLPINLKPRMKNMQITNNLSVYLWICNMFIIAVML